MHQHGTDLDNCPRCRYRHLFSTEADWELAVKLANALLDVGGFPPIPHMRASLVNTAIEWFMKKTQVPASPDVAEAQARANGGDQ